MKQKYINCTTGKWINGDLDTQYRIEETEDTIKITFQGSVSVLDWFHNFDFLVKPYRGMPKLFFVHRGFLKKWKAVRDNIMSRVISSGKAVEIYGFSQGAALAQLCHEAILFHSGFQPKTVVFGSPKVFGWFNKKELDDRLYRVERYENGRDIVTGVPFFLYRHYGLLKKIGKWGRIKTSIKDHLTYGENL